MNSKFLSLLAGACVTLTAEGKAFSLEDEREANEVWQPAHPSSYQVITLSDQEEENNQNGVNGCCGNGGCTCNGSC